MATVTRPYAWSLAWLLLGLLNSCGPPLYFATHQAQQITRLEQAGDVQLQVSGQLDLGIQQLYQAEAEVAVSRFLANRHGWFLRFTLSQFQGCQLAGLCQRINLECQH